MRYNEKDAGEQCTNVSSGLLVTLLPAILICVGKDTWCWDILLFRKDCMPKRSLVPVLAWSSERKGYELSWHGHREQHFGPKDEAQWFAWLATHRAFAFEG